jgi:hypothetical protein
MISKRLFVLKGLGLNQTYAIKLRANNANGVGVASKVVFVKVSTV